METKSDAKSVTITLPAGKWFYTSVILVLVLAVSVFYNFDANNKLTDYAAAQNNPTPTPTPTASPSTIANVAVDDDPQLGPSNAKVTIVTFSDYQCPYCSRAEATIDQITETYGNQVRIVFRDFPLSFHANAEKAAEASECAHEQNKFWEYHDVLFASQSALDVDSLKKYASDLGLDTAQFNSCLDSGKYAQEVQKDFTDGQSYGVSGTPTFFIGTGTTTIKGEKVVGAQPFASFKAVIDKYLA